MKKWLANYKKLNSGLQKSIAISGFSTIISILLAITSKDDIVIYLCSALCIFIFVGNIIYLSYKTKKFTKFASLNDERLVMARKDATLILIKYLGLFVCIFIGGSLGFLIGKHDTLSFTQVPIDTILLVSSLTLLAIIIIGYILFWIIFKVLLKD